MKRSTQLAVFGWCMWLASTTCAVFGLTLATLYAVGSAAFFMAWAAYVRIGESAGSATT